MFELGEPELGLKAQAGLTDLDPMDPQPGLREEPEDPDG